MRWLLSLSFVLFACGKGGGGSSPASNPFHGDLPPSQDVTSFLGQYNAQIVRALANNLDGQGQVAAKKPDGGWDDQGDAAYFTGIMLGSVDCLTGTQLLDVVLKSIGDNGGMIASHNPLLPGYTITSRDQATGVMFGLVERWRKCPGDRPAITAAWMQNVAYVDGHGGDLGPNIEAKMLTLHWLWGAVGQYFNAGGGGGSKQEFDAGLITTVTGINADHSACYPAATGTLQAITAAKIGKAMDQTSRQLFCDGTRGLNLPLTEWYCERQPAAQWLSIFQPDVWIYRHQRCPGWEKPDANGEQTAGDDEMVLYSLATEGQG